jgi:hypothetical protein
MIEKPVACGKPALATTLIVVEPAAVTAAARVV